MGECLSSVHKALGLTSSIEKKQLIILFKCFLRKALEDTLYHWPLLPMGKSV